MWIRREAQAHYEYKTKKAESIIADTEAQLSLKPPIKVLVGLVSPSLASHSIWDFGTHFFLFSVGPFYSLT